MENPIESPFSYGFPMVFPWFPRSRAPWSTAEHRSRITSPHLGCADTWKDLPEVLDVIEVSGVAGVRVGGVLGFWDQKIRRYTV